jgi:hypothetical protein
LGASISPIWVTIFSEFHTVSYIKFRVKELLDIFHTHERFPKAQKKVIKNVKYFINVKILQIWI